MKIKTDFVTNSSSTSFIIITENGLKEIDFMKLMGVTEECELYHMVEELYYRIKNEMLEVHEAYKSKYYRDSYETFREFITDQFSDEVYQKVLDVEENNWTVYIGKLNSDEEPFISFVCCDCFVEETDKIYFNYTNCSW